jgi:hypothetical protein
LLRHDKWLETGFLPQMPSSTKCGVRLTDVLWTWLSGDLTRHFPETIHLSGQQPTGEERVPYIITYPCAFDSPQMCELRPSQAEVDIVATTLWLGHESMQTATVPLVIEDRPCTPPSCLSQRLKIMPGAIQAVDSTSSFNRHTPILHGKGC